MKSKETQKYRKNVLQELKSGFHQIKNNYNYIKKLAKEGEEVLGSGEWLLDNIYLIEKEYKSIKENMPVDYFNNLPPCEVDECVCVPRIFVFAKEYIRRKDDVVNEYEVTSFIRNKDEKLTMGELWAFPLMLRCSLIIKLSKITNKLVQMQSEKNTGKYIAYEIIDSKNKNQLEQTLKSIDEKHSDMSPLLLDELLKILRDNSIEDPKIYSFVNSKSNRDELDEELIKNNFLEGSIEQSIGSIITSLREIEGMNWRKFFNLISKVEEILVKDPNGIYEMMDFESKDYYRHKIESLAKKLQISEITLTEKILFLALRSKDTGKNSYKTHVGYYIIDDGIQELVESFESNIKVRNKFSVDLYILINLIGTIAIIFITLGLGYIFSLQFTLSQYIISGLLMIIPASEIVMSLFNWINSKVEQIRMVPKLDYSKGIPVNKKTVIVIPAILPTPERTIELMKQLEVAYLANKDSNFYFALLGDFCDSKEEHGDFEEEIVEAGLKETLRLNMNYFNGEKHFFFLNRKKKFNRKQGVFMGRERKRGKLMEFMALIKNGNDHTFNVISSQIKDIEDVKYIITLDADTFIPKDSAFKLVGAMSHVLNKSIITDQKVRRGYGIMQPKISISLESMNKTKFSKVFAGEGGIDGYSIAYSDTYEDLFGEGTFTGKGILDIDTCYELLKNSIHNDTVLSHDLLEGALVGASLVTDVEFIDDYPASYEASCRRLHRWVRGDWQLLRWLSSTKISSLSKWKMIDNLRRSLLAPNLLLGVILSLTYLRGTSRVTLVCFLAAIIPLVFTVTDFVVTPKNKISGTFKSFKQIMFILSFIPYQAYLMCDAIVRTLFRITVSKRNLLQWQTAEQVDLNTDNGLKAYVKRMWFAILIGLATIVLSIVNIKTVSIINLPIGVAWVMSPYIAYKLSKVEPKEEFKLNYKDEIYLRENSRRIWAYYQDFVNEENNFLAPDNYQEEPFKGVAHRTSPTNIGMGLTSNLVAYDLGYLTFGEVVDRIELVLKSMNSLEKCNGHLLNWYDTQTREPLWPRYVSTVDSGNLLGYLWIIKETLVEYKNSPLIREEELSSIKDTIRIIGLDETESTLERFDDRKIGEYIPLLEELLFSLGSIDLEEIEDEEKKYWIEKLKNEIKMKVAYYDYFFDGIEKLLVDDYDKKSPSIYELLHHIEDILISSGDDFREILEARMRSLKAFVDRVDKIIIDITSMINEMNFKFLFNEERGLFSIGFNLEEDSLGNSYYDLLASESRATSFITIAMNQVPTSHWFKLSRAMTNAFREKTLVSWSGTMFEYFMPSLIMKSYDKTLLSLTYDSVIKAQKNFAKKKSVPWGISESAYYQFDLAQNYQYKAFGVPGIGLKRGLEDEVVVSPYSTLITLPYSKDSGIQNLRAMQSNETYGRYGFIEAIDYTPGRVSKIESDDIDGKNVRCYMVHHLGMSLMALNNILNKNIFQERFHRIPEIKAVELLLKERIPERITFENEEDFISTRKKLERENFMPRMYEGAKRDNPEVLLLSNGSYSTMLTLSGSGYGKKEGMTVYRWKGDNTSDSSGMFFYIKNLNSNDYWSATYEPCKYGGEDYKVEFTLDKGVYTRKDGSIETKMEVVVSPEDDLEIRKVILKNTGDKGRSLEVTSYMEVTLQSFEGDAVHPSFSNLFIGTEYISEEACLLGNRRARVKNGVVPYILHKVLVPSGMDGAITYETSRVNFIGRNRDLKKPRALDNDVALLNTEGTVLDPIMSMRVRVRLEAGEEKEIYYITGTTNSKNEALEIASKYNDKRKMEKAFEAYNRAIQLELKNLGIRSAQANIYQSLASYILFLHSGREDRAEYIKNINKNQQDLWAYGISGDLPIAMALVKSEEDMDLIRGMLKMHYYWKTKGLKVDLIIYNDEESSYEQPLQRNIMGAISFSKEMDAVNKPGGIFIHNKATMGEDIRNLLIGISSLYVDSEKGSIITQIKEVEEKSVGCLRHKELGGSGFRVRIDKEKDKNKINDKISDCDLDELQITDYELQVGENKTNNINNNYINDGSLDEELVDGDYELAVVENNINTINKKNNQINDCSLDRYIVDDCYVLQGEDNKTNNRNKNKKTNNDGELRVSDNEVHGTKSSLNNNNNNSDDYVELDFWNGYGGFDPGDKSYVIKLKNYRNTPAPWINVVSNDDFGFHISESGAGFTWCGNSRENKITPWSNDWVTDPIGEGLYIKDNNSGVYFSIAPKPVRDGGEYNIRHSFGYSTFKHTAYNIKGEMKIFAPREEKVKLQIVTLENLLDKEREVSIYYYAQLVLGVFNYGSARYISTDINNDCIIGVNPYSKYFGTLKAYLSILGGENISFTGDRKEFLGVEEDLSAPNALKETSLSNRAGSIYDPCLAAETKILLRPGEKKEIIILLGQDENEENIAKIIEKYRSVEECKKSLEEVKQYWSNFLGNIQVETKDKSMNYMLNGWLLYQTYGCRYLSRTAFYQSGGAYGFRDQLQDSMSLGIVNSEITKEQILRNASRQYLEGDVQHWWHPVVNSGIRTRFSDDLLWLPYVTAEYIKRTGDYSILEERATYLEDEPLNPGEDERYTIVNSSSKDGTVYEHCIKAIDRGLKFGEHNIPLMGSGDWNDGMSTVGNEGKGESVWLGWFLYEIIGSFETICSHMEDNEKLTKYKEMKDFIKENLEKNAWDGGWYRRAYFDDGTPLGSRENEECQIDSLAQSWSIISGAGKKERAIEAMEAVDRNLVNKDRGMILLLAPPFNKSKLEPGYIKGYVPGVRENGGQYTHAAVWVILALTKLGLGDKAWKYYNMINPINHTNTELECRTYKLEPYVMAADVYIKEPHAGRGGWSWYTGASGWMYKVGIEDILGLQQVEGKGYKIVPCVPKEWNEYKIYINNETEQYNIRVMRGMENKITINGVEIDGDLIPKGQGMADIVVVWKDM